MYRFPRSSEPSGAAGVPVAFLVQLRLGAQQVEALLVRYYGQ